MIFKTLIITCLVVVGVTRISYIIDNKVQIQNPEVVLKYVSREKRLEELPDPNDKASSSNIDTSSADGETSSSNSTTINDYSKDDISDSKASKNNETLSDIAVANDESNSGQNINDKTNSGESQLSESQTKETETGSDNSQTDTNEDASSTGTNKEDETLVNGDEPLTTRSETDTTDKSPGDKDTNSDKTQSENDRVQEACASVEMTNCTVDHHKYYKAVYIQDDTLWIELCPDEGSQLDSIKHMNLSSAAEKRGYRTDAHLSLKEYLFYGLPIYNVTILTGGFLHVGPAYYSQIITQANYIAPFMGNFNPSQSNESNIYYYSDEKVFIVQWDKMQLDNKPDKGTFTFQVQLHNNSDIVFAYKQIPIVELPADEHETSVGISDAFHMTEKNNVVINVYHELKVNKTKIGSNTAVKLVIQTLCTMLDNCYDCTTASLPDFECRWCSKLNKCSDREGDRDLQNWHEAGCSVTNKKPGQKCDEYCYFPPSPLNTTYTPAPDPERSIINANSTGTSTVRVQCDAEYAVSANYDTSAAGIYQCTSGGIEVPACKKSCKYTTAPTNGKLQGVATGHLIRPDASFAVYCNPGHRLRSESVKEVKCIENGILEPDPANIRCEKYCSLPHLPFTYYMPEPTAQGILHEGESTNMMCTANHILGDYAAGTFPNSTILMTCTENANLGALTRECVGYCSFLASHPNTTYTPAIPMIGDQIDITCANGTALLNGSSKKQFTCSQPELLDLPTCLYKPVETEAASSTANSLKILLAIFICTVVCIVGAWVLYAYRHPTSPSGLFLIEKCRPWTWRTQSRYSRHHDSLADSYYMDGGI